MGCYTEKDDMKQIDRQTAKRIRRLAYGPAIAGVIVFIIACVAKRIALGLMLLGVTLYVIALAYFCIRQKCYSQLAVSLVMFVLAVVIFIIINDDSLLAAP